MHTTMTVLHSQTDRHSSEIWSPNTQTHCFKVNWIGFFFTHAQDGPLAHTQSYYYAIAYLLNSNNNNNKEMRDVGEMMTILKFNFLFPD